MKKLSIALLAGVIAASFLFGCGNDTQKTDEIPGTLAATQDMPEAPKAKSPIDHPVDQMIGHMDTVVTILEQNKDDATKATELVKKYATDNKAALETLKKELDELEKGMSPEENAKMKQEATAKIKPLMDRVLAVTMANPELGKAMQALDLK